MAWGWSRVWEQQEPWQVALLLLLLCSALLLLLRHTINFTTTLLLPPGPRPWPLVGNLLQVTPLLHRDFARLSKQYGPLLFLRLGSMKVLVVSSAEMAKMVMQTQDNDFCSRPKSSALMRIITFDFQDFIMGEYGERWRLLKKIIVSELLSPKRLASFKLRRAEQIMSTMRLIKLESEEGKVIDIREKLYQCFSNIVTSMIANKAYFGPQTDPHETRDFFGIITQTLELIGSLNPGDVLPFLKPFDLLGMEKKARKCNRRLLKFCQDILDEHRRRQHKNGESYVEDFVDVLLASPGVEEGANSISDVTMAAVIQDILIAGTDTSSNTTEWALAELIRNPKIMRKAQEELASVVGPDRLVTEEDIPNLKYVNAILKETFRYHPVVPTLVPRVSPKGGCKLAGYDIPEDTTVFVNAWAIGRDPAVWDRPDEFDPERFMGSNPRDVRGQNFELIPFGAGRRMCTGINLGLLMSHLALAQLIHCFDWTVPDGQRGLLDNMTETAGFTSAIANPLQVLVYPRLSPSII